MVYEYHKTLRASRATVPNTLRSVCVPCHSVQYPAFQFLRLYMCNNVYLKTLRASRATVPNTLRSVCVPCHSVQYPALGESLEESLEEERNP